MTLNTQKRGFVEFFAIFGSAHFSTVNCDEMAGDRPRQPAYVIVTIECRF